MVAIAVVETDTPSCVCVAVIVTRPPGGGKSGAVKRPVESIEPMLPPSAEVAVQVAVGSKTLLKVAENWLVPPAGTVTLVGVTARPSPTPIVTMAVFDVTVGIVVVLVDEEGC